ncbi:murein biosynthesis integral membrane protein MurJ [Luethyella okanaganae]|uniref:Murein biosynthesis integral membrane protein MurJ n=1 Tax=Luethyella okanaganae TaxID=69372 RepID=A0ABW1VIE2_9MICO
MSESGIGRASAFLASGTIVSRLLGFVKAIVLAQTIGTIGRSADAFAVANQLPNNLYVIIAGGVLSAVLVPQIVRASIHPDGGRGYINKLLTITLVIIGGATVVAVLIAPVLVTVYAPSWEREQQALATAFAYWCLPQIFFYGLYTVLGEILNARKMFGPFTWAPVLNNVVAILGLLGFIALFGSAANTARAVTDWTPGMIALIGGSATLGVAAQALILFVFWRRAGLSYRPDFAWRGVGLGAAGRLAGWTFGMLLLTQLAGLVETQVASIASGDASVTTLQFSWLIFMLPHSVITVSIATAYFTRMAEHTRGDDRASLRADISAAVRVTSLLIVFSAAVLIVVAYPFASLFTVSYDDIVAMGLIIIAFVLGLVPFCILFVIQRGFYALGDTRTPFFFTLFQVVLFSGGALLVGLLLPKVVIGLGIALVMSIAGTAQMVLAWRLLSKRLDGLESHRIVSSLLRYAIAALPALFAGFVVLVLTDGVGAGGFGTASFPGAVLCMTATGATMGIVYFGLLALFRVPELQPVIDPLLARIRR